MALPIYKLTFILLGDYRLSRRYSAAPCSGNLYFLIQLTNPSFSIVKSKKIFLTFVAICERCQEKIVQKLCLMRRKLFSQKIL